VPGPAEIGPTLQHERVIERGRNIAPTGRLFLTRLSLFRRDERNSGWGGRMGGMRDYLRPLE
jgi:hypothetical protein